MLRMLIQDHFNIPYATSDIFAPDLTEHGFPMVLRPSRGSLISSCINGDPFLLRDRDPDPVRCGSYARVTRCRCRH